MRAVVAAAAALTAATLAGCSAAGTSGSGGGSSSSVQATGSTLAVYLSVPARPTGAEQAVVTAVKTAFTAQQKAVSAYALRLVPVQDPLLSDNARTAIQDKSAIAYLGELATGESKQTVGITGAVDLLELSPTDSSPVPDADYESLSTYGHTFVADKSGQQGAAAGTHAVTLLIDALKSLGKKANDRASVVKAVRKSA